MNRRKFLKLSAAPAALALVSVPVAACLLDEDEAARFNLPRGSRCLPIRCVGNIKGSNYFPVRPYGESAEDGQGMIFVWPASSGEHQGPARGYVEELRTETDYLLSMSKPNDLNAVILFSIETRYENYYLYRLI